MASTSPLCIALTALLVGLPSIIMIALSFHRLQTTEVGLDYNTFRERVNTQVYMTPGLHFLGLPHRFIRFEKVVQTVQYTDDEGDILHTRTADGLPVTLGLSFQFRFDTARAYDLYMTFGKNHLQVLDNKARATVANVACNYSAYKFFSDKQGIAAHMQRVLDQELSENLYASIDALQIETIELPFLFQNAILDSIKMKQQIQATLKYKENMQVTFEQEIMVAVQSKQQTIVLAHGEAARIMELASANANVTTATVDAQINAYSMVAEALGFSASSQELLDYIWWESQQELGGKGKSSYMVGVNQAVYVAGGSPGAPVKSPLYS